MEAFVQYNDLTGSAAADITDATTTHSLSQLGELFDLDTDRYDIVGVSIYGVEEPFISFLCVDNAKSTDDKPHIVKIRMEGIESIDQIFKRLEVTLYERGDQKYRNLNVDEEIWMGDENDEEEA